MRLFEINTIEQQKQENCGLFLSSRIKLYRGTRIDKGWDFIGTIRDDRRAKTSTPFEVEIFDAYCEANGWPHRKANTLSVTSYSSQAKTYGDYRYEIFPFDGTQYLYSTDHMNFSDFLSIPYFIIKLYITEVHAEAIASHSEINRDWAYTKFKQELHDSPEKKKELFNWIRNNTEMLNTKMGMHMSTDPMQLRGVTEGEILLYGAQYIGVLFDKR